MGKCKQNDEWPQQFKHLQCKQETHLAEFQPTVLNFCPVATKQKEIVPVVDYEVNNLENFNYDTLTVKPNNTDDLSAKFIKETHNTPDN
jgi:hypothetical protein